MDEKVIQAIRAVMKEELNPIREDIASMRSTLDDHSQVLKALEHHAQITRAEQDKLIHDVAHLQGGVLHLQEDVTEIKRDMYRMEEATASNWVDIVKLKAAKQT